MLERFSPHLGQSFTATLKENASSGVALILTEAQLSRYAGENGRPFHLVFEGPADLRLEQGTYWLSRGEEEPEPIFLVPIGPRQYEAVFN